MFFQQLHQWVIAPGLLAHHSLKAGAPLLTFYLTFYSSTLRGIYSDILFCHSIPRFYLAVSLAFILAFLLTWALPRLNPERQISVGTEIWSSYTSGHVTVFGGCPLDASA